MATNSKQGKQYKAPKRRVLDYKLKSISQTRKDMRSYKDSLNMACYVEEPSNWMMQQLFNEIMKDALLSSQIENLKDQIFSSQYNILHDGEEDEEATHYCRKSSAFKEIMNTIIDTIDRAYSVIELGIIDGKLTCDLIPRDNIVPQKGLFFPDYTETMNFVKYRELREFGTWILEFNILDIAKGEFGTLIKAVPHVLMKRFAQSCWSELCEIYGIPPRVLKTNTSDVAMLNRGEQMMSDMAAAAWFIIDESEELQFATGVATNGDVYKKLITLCSNEISLLISGAVIGQDTENGSRSKEQVSQDLLWVKAQARMLYIEQVMNETVLPALAKIGLVKEGSTLNFSEAEDTNKLFEFTQPFLNSAKYRVKPDWIKDKFGVEVEEVKPAQENEDKPDNKKLSASLPSNFFD